MPKQLETILIVPDTHRPYHDKKAWALMLAVGRAIKPKHIIVLGDLADFYTVSFFSKDPKRMMTLDEEIKDVNKGLTELDSLGAGNKIYVAGNHEYRLERYLTERAPEVSHLVDIPKIFKLTKRGWNYTAYKDDTRLGKLYITHDVTATGRNAIFKALDTYQHCVVTGHTHRMGYVVEGNAAGVHHVSATFGWLGDAKYADYMHRVKASKDWALGFGVGYYEPKTGNVFLQVVPIVNYQCVVNGKLYK